MARPNSLIAAVTLSLVAATGCTMKKQEAPGLTGPSELGTSLAMSASPDVIYQDGASQSLVTIQARDQNGQPKSGLSIRTAISVNGVLTDFGSLSARNVVTDSNGKATVVYTAPSAPPIGVDSGTVVDIEVTPQANEFGNSNSRSVSIRLIPPGIVVPPGDLVPKFTVSTTSPQDHQDVLFDASQSTSNPLNPIVSYKWSFGDGDTASGVTVQHHYDDPGTYFATLTIADGVGRSASTSTTITVSAGPNPTATFTTSPSSAGPNQTIFFNASASKAAPGRSISRYDWSFGDGGSANGVEVTHAYAAAGSYTVTLTVTDDVGRTTVTNQTITVTTASPTADFTFSPTAPTAGSAVNFNGATSRPATGRSIVSYSWFFGDGTSGSGVSVNHTYTTPGTYSVILSVVDDQGNTGSTTKTVTVS